MLSDRDGYHIVVASDTSMYGPSLDHGELIAGAHLPSFSESSRGILRRNQYDQCARRRPRHGSKRSVHIFGTAVLASHAQHDSTPAPCRAAAIKPHGCAIRCSDQHCLTIAIGEHAPIVGWRGPAQLSQHRTIRRRHRERLAEASGVFLTPRETPKHSARRACDYPR